MKSCSEKDAGEIQVLEEEFCALRIEVSKLKMKNLQMEKDLKDVRDELNQVRDAFKLNAYDLACLQLRQIMDSAQHFLCHKYLPDWNFIPPTYHLGILEIELEESHRGLKKDAI